MPDSTREAPHASVPFEREVVEMYIRAQSPRSVYLEIGSSSGASLGWYGRLCDRGGQLLAVDREMPSGNGAKCRRTLTQVLRDLCEREYNVSLIDGDSTDPETVDRVRNKLDGRKVDILLIDGGHEGHIVYQDVANYVPFVRSGGLVIMHDVGPCIRMGGEKRMTLRSARIPLVIDCFAAWRSLASRHDRKLIVQEAAGYGLVWID